MKKGKQQPTLSGVDEKAPNEAPIRSDLSGLFVLLLVDRSRPALRVQSSLAFEPGCVCLVPMQYGAVVF